MLVTEINRYIKNGFVLIVQAGLRKPPVVIKVKINSTLGPKHF